MKKSIFKFLLPVILLATVSCNNSNRNESDNNRDMAENENNDTFRKTSMEDDTEFVKEAALGGMMEVELGQLAQTKASSAQVKQFGQTMVNDHGKANDELRTLAQQKSITLPTTLDDKHQKKYDDLAEKTGTDFDKAYMDLMVKDHKKDIDEFKDEAQDGNDPDIKSWASEKVPVLQHHLEMAQNTQDMVKGGT